jgi:hypothetical protein
MVDSTTLNEHKFAEAIVMYNNLREEALKFMLKVRKWINTINNERIYISGDT